MSETVIPIAAGSDLVAQLRSTLERAGELTRGLEVSLREVVERDRERSSDERVADLERRLATSESDVSSIGITGATRPSAPSTANPASRAPRSSSRSPASPSGAP